MNELSVCSLNWHSMGIGKLIFAFSSTFPGLTTSILKFYLRTGLPVPERAKWIVTRIAREIIPSNPDRLVSIGMDLKMKLDLRGRTARGVYYRGSCEPEFYGFLCSVLKPDQVFVDAGANIGEFTLRASKLVGPNGRVVSVEAMPEAVSSIKENIALNGLSNVDLVPCVLGGHCALRTFYIASGVGTGASSTTPPANHEGKSIQVEGITLDELSLRTGVDRIDLIKLDIEGEELELLSKGANSIFSDEAHRPMIVFEYNDEVAKRAGWDMNDMSRLFSSQAFDLHYINENGVGPRVDSGELRGETVVQLTNYVAIPQSS